MGEKESFSAGELAGPLGKVLAGILSPKEFFTNSEYQTEKESFLEKFKEACPGLLTTKFGEVNLAAAWLTKLRFNGDMTNDQFEKHITRSDKIFFPKGDLILDLRNSDPDHNDCISMQWGLEALNGVQGYDSGVTKLRFPPDIGPKIFSAFQKGGGTRAHEFPCPTYPN